MTERAPVLCAHYQFTRPRWVHFCGQNWCGDNGIIASRVEFAIGSTVADQVHNLPVE